MRHPQGRRRRAGDQRAPAAEPAPPDFTPHDLTGLFVVPQWLRDLGTSAWLAVGVAVAVAAAIALLSLTQTIVMPVLTAAVVAAVASPLIGGMKRRGVPRGVGAALLLVGVIVLVVVVATVIVGGITGQEDQLRRELTTAKDTMAGWLTDLGVDDTAAQNAKNDVSSAANDAVPALLKGLGHGLAKLSSLVMFLALTALSLFFLLKDSHEIRRWLERHMRVPAPVAHQMGNRVLQSLRGYFVGVTIIAAFNAVVVFVGALIVGAPLVGTIVLVTFLGAYVPYLGAWTAGAFAVLVTLGGAGTDAAIGMIVVQLLANGILQQLVQPVAMGAALGIHPLAVLIVTIAGGSLFGAAGLILAAPLTAAATRIASDFAQARAVALAEGPVLE